MKRGGRHSNQFCFYSSVVKENICNISFLESEYKILSKTSILSVRIKTENGQNKLVAFCVKWKKKSDIFS